MRDGGTAWLRAVAAALVAAVCCSAAFSAAAADRVALVVGNGAYAHAPKLANPVNDATAVGATLERLGFSVTRVENAGYDTLRRRLRDFGRASRGAEVAVAFYAGHGIEVGGRNYLVPVDAALANDGDVAFEAVGLDLVVGSVEGASRFGLVILDACRDNPFVARMERAGPARAVGRGLARVEPQGVTLVAYAAAAGQTASDGSGRHSPYTTALLEHLASPGLDVGQMFRRVRESVEASTGGSQKPVYYGSLPSAGAYLSSPPPDDGDAMAAVPGGEPLEALVDADRVFWESISGSEDPADFEAYLDEFPSGLYARLARNRLARLGDGGAVSPSDPVPTPGSSGADHAALESGLRLDRAERLDVQSGLNSLGFDVGPVDGAVGPRTRNAISSWQREKGYEATAYLTRKQADALIASGRAAREREAAERERVPEIGDFFRDCPHCPRMVVVPPGSFLIGSPASEEGRFDQEGPRHRVTIGSLFAVGVYEVTRGEFGRFVSSTGRSMGDSCWVWEDGEWEDRSGRGWRDPGFSQDDSHPVVCVSWEDARAYARWLSDETGKSYRLLSESEWEYVARAGTVTRYWWGDSSSSVCRYANGADANSGLGWGVDCEDGYSRTSPVGSFSANGFGLHDVAGNVWEWVQDCWNGSYAGAPVDGSAWERGDCSRRVLRGGSWDIVPEGLRAAFRVRLDSGYRYSVNGFRLVRTFTP